MDELMKNISEAFDLVSAIPVTGQSVEKMAAVRANLRTAYQLADKLKTEKRGVEDNGH